VANVAMRYPYESGGRVPCDPVGGRQFLPHGAGRWIAGEWQWNSKTITTFWA